MRCRQGSRITAGARAVQCHTMTESWPVVYLHPRPSVMLLRKLHRSILIVQVGGGGCRKGAQHGVSWIMGRQCLACADAAMVPRSCPVLHSHTKDPDCKCSVVYRPPVERVSLSVQLHPSLQF